MGKDVLRKKAEDRLKAEAKVIENMSEKGIRKLAHELQVHQIELEMQNDELRKAYSELEESREKYSDLYDFAPVGYLTLDNKGIVLEANLTAANLLSVERINLIKSSFQQYIKREDHDIFYFYLMKLIESKKAQICELRLKDKGDSDIHAQLDSIFLEDSNNKITLRTSMIDITRRKLIEEQLLKSKKLESLGILAGGIAHDFNNILTSIIGYTEITIDESPKDSEARTNLNQVLNCGYRARDLVKQILTFSRKGEQKREIIEFYLLLHEVLELTRASLPSTIEIRENIHKNSGSVFADLSQMHQVVMNLCVNAGQSMQDNGGILEVSLKSMHVDDKFISDHQLKNSSYLKLTISDTGSGMDKQTLEKIFDPFFTTKGVGKGTGLGLSTAHGIVASHGGKIFVESEVDKGTTFTVYIPKTEDKKGDKDSQGDMRVPCGNERILLVDDDGSIAEMYKKMLGNLGYTVEAKTCSSEALRAFQANPDGFDLVITDLTMPKMTGEVLAEKLIKIRSDIPIILCTGYSNIITDEKAKTIGIKKFIMKPIIMRELSESVRIVLDQNR